jgi:hypothetical protein
LDRLIKGKALRLKELGAPENIQSNEQRMIGEALNELRAFAIEHGVVPSDSDKKEAERKIADHVDRVMPAVKRALPHVTDEGDLNIVATMLAEQGHENPMNSEIHDIYRQWNSQVEELDDDGYPEENDSPVDDA